MCCHDERGLSRLLDLYHNASPIFLVFFQDSIEFPTSLTTNREFSAKNCFDFPIMRLRQSILGTIHTQISLFLTNYNFRIPKTTQPEPCD